MRPRTHKRNKKITTKHKVSKNKARSSSEYTNNVSILDIENINEVLRANKRTGGKITWKIVPKDSCEVYKNRFSRQTETKIQQNPKRNVKNVNNHGNQRQRNKTQKRYVTRNTRKTAKKPQPRTYKYRNRKMSMDSSDSSATTLNSCMSSSDY